MIVKYTILFNFHVRYLINNQGLPLGYPKDIQVFHAATELKESTYSAKSGRILTVVVINRSMLAASSIAKEVCSSIHFDGCQYRDDIANKAMAR